MVSFVFDPAADVKSFCIAAGVLLADCHEVVTATCVQVLEKRCEKGGGDLDCLWWQVLRVVSQSMAAPLEDALYVTCVCPCCGGGPPGKCTSKRRDLWAGTAGNVHLRVAR